RALHLTTPRFQSLFFSQRTELRQVIRRKIPAPRFAPQTLEVIEPAGLLVKHVHHKITVINQDPLSILIPFDACCRTAMMLKLLDYFIADSLRLTTVRSGSNQKEICETGDPAQIKHGRIDRFLLSGRMQRDRKSTR